MSTLTAKQKIQRRRLMSDRPLYCRRCLKIVTKAGGAPQPFKLNATQRFVDEKLDAQLTETGKVRALVLKGRQTGVSTYVEARFYHRATHHRGWNTFILTHNQAATDNLFAMTNRFHDHCPSRMRPSTGKANAKELIFDKLDSRYQVATAGSQDIGRSATIQLFHGSEVGFWPNGPTHIEGVGQAVANAPGTEVILESTANGVNNLFHLLWKKAEAGKSDYVAIFAPWFLHEEYREAPPEDWEPPPDPGDEDAVGFNEYREAHGLEPDRLYWAWKKNRELATTIGQPDDRVCWKFQQEYPGSADEAFQMAGVSSFISPVKVVRARNRKVEPYGPIILGVDPARGGGDETGFVDRQLRRLGMHVCCREELGQDLMQVAARVVHYIKELRPKGLVKVPIDITGIGAGVYDRLVELGYGDIVEGVNFGAGARLPKRFANRRAETYSEMADWFKDDEGLGVQCHDSDAFQGDLCALQWGEGGTKYRSNGQLILEPKEHIVQRLKFSPDLADAGALTFALDMNDLLTSNKLLWENQGHTAQGGWMAS